jgi:hypothetical protein
MADLKTTNIFGDAYINNKVGIATNAPATRLQIGQLSPTAATEGIQFGDDTGTRIYRSSTGALTLNGSVVISANGLNLSASTALQGNYGDWSGESNKIQWHSNNLYFVNRGGGSWIFRNSSAANVVDIASNGTTTISGNISAANLSGTNTGDQTIGNGTITIAAGTGIGVGTTNTFTMNQSGNTTVTVTNSGVTSNVAGTGISVSGATGAVTITNSGVTSLAGTTNRITVSAGTGGVTLNLPQDIHTGASPTFSAVTASLSGNATTATSINGFGNPTTNSTANTIVYREGNGYITNNYFYTSGGGSERNASGMAYFAGFNSSDYYIRSYTAAAVATLISGQTMNINGSSTSCSGNAATATNSTQLGGVVAARYVRNDTDGTAGDLYSLVTVTKSLTVTTSWLDTGISAGSDLVSGAYILTLNVDNYAVSGGHYNETYTGIMYWYAGSTNSTDYDEIPLHKSGHAPNTRYINLRTLRGVSGVLKLQIISSVTTSGASNYVFKFRRII